MQLQPTPIKTAVTLAFIMVLWLTATVAWRAWLSPTCTVPCTPTERGCCQAPLWVRAIFLALVLATPAVLYLAYSYLQKGPVRF